MRTLALLALVAAGFVSACGYRGDLERPPPMWGGEAAPEKAREPTDDEGRPDQELEREDPTEVPSERERSPT